MDAKDRLVKLTPNDEGMVDVRNVARAMRRKPRLVAEFSGALMNDTLVV